MKYRTDITGDEKAVFAFFRAGNFVPDMEAWIKQNPQYRTLSENKKRNFMIEEMLRLDRGFGQYDNGKEVLEIKANVFVKYIPQTEGQEPRVTFGFPYQDDHYIPTFIYSYGENSIALIINKLASFSNLVLSEQQNEIVLQKIPYENDIVDAVLHVHVRVTQADYDNPTEVSGKKQWVMLGEVAYLKCVLNSHYHGTKDQVLWDYVAPWYEKEYKQKTMSEEEKYPHPYDLFKD